MGLVPDHVATIRESIEDHQPKYEPKDVVVEVTGDQPEDLPVLDQKGNILEIKHGDGSITVSLDGRPIQSATKGKDSGWFDNLAEEIPEGELNRIAEDLMLDIDSDETNRSTWIEDRALFIRLMGLKPDIHGSTSDGAPVEGMSKIRHPMLLEAVLRFQANARSELLPTDGPVKIRDDDAQQGSRERDRMAEALETDFNHYLTTTASEYVPDTDRMLLMLGLGGTAFKKVYFCPLRGRPVSESVDAADLIVASTATDLANSPRVTHRISMKRSTLKRMQILGVYRDIDIQDPNEPDVDAAQAEKDEQQGVRRNVFDATKRDYTILECYCELNIEGFEHKLKGKETGLELPYRVTIEKDSRRILSIVRDYDEEDQDMPTRRRTFVKYSFVPGMGFYDIGLGHILVNTNQAVTAAWRELLDAGMFANFPGFLYAKQTGRQATNLFRVPPGGGVPVDTGGNPINSVVMPLPYKEPSTALQLMAKEVAETGSRLGGTAEIQVGEGRQDAPVGTTLAMIEQAQKVLNSVHKRLHAAQAEEFQLLAQCFREHPEAFWQRNRKPATEWSEDLFRKALDEWELIPQADPNTASHMQRLMKAMALKQLQAANPTLYQGRVVDEACLGVIGWDNAQQFFVPDGFQPPPDPKVIAESVKAEAAMITAKAKQSDVQVKAGAEMNKGQLEQHKLRAADRMQAIDYTQELMRNPEAAHPAHPARPIMEQLHPLISKIIGETSLPPVEPPNPEAPPQPVPSPMG